MLNISSFLILISIFKNSIKNNHYNQFAVRETSETIAMSITSFEKKNKELLVNFILHNSINILLVLLSLLVKTILVSD